MKTCLRALRLKRGETAQTQLSVSETDKQIKNCRSEFQVLTVTVSDCKLWQLLVKKQVITWSEAAHHVTNVTVQLCAAASVLYTLKPILMVWFTPGLFIRTAPFHPSCSWALLYRCSAFYLKNIHGVFVIWKPPSCSCYWDIKKEWKY